MKSLNIYLLTRVKHNDSFNEMFNSETNNKEFIEIKEDEQQTLIELVDLINNCGNEGKEIFDGFYLDFKIPHIGKEFDLLKASDNKTTVLNIELKSQDVELDKVKKQLHKNKSYLNAVFQNINQFTYICGGKLYKYQDNQLLESSISELIDVLKLDVYGKYIDSNLDCLFMAKDYLISPINDIDRFLEGKYFLTNEQFEKKHKIIDLFEKRETILVILSGRAGTGKTLLAYDIAVELSQKSKVLILFCGKLTNGHITLNSKLKNVDIVQIKDINKINLNYDLVIIDEVQRIKGISWSNVINLINKAGIPMMLVGDEEQYLSAKEKESGYFLNTINRFVESNKRIIFTLNERIRTNPEMASFIKNLLNYNSNINYAYSYDNIQICYANCEDEAIELICYFKNNKYIFINFTGAFQGDIYYDAFRNYENLNSHEAVGQEFDNVVIVINENFTYGLKNSQYILQTRIHHPTQDYLYRKMLFQALTRAREKIAIIIVKDITLFRRINSIKIKKNL